MIIEMHYFFWLSNVIGISILTTRQPDSTALAGNAINNCIS